MDDVEETASAAWGFYVCVCVCVCVCPQWRLGLWQAARSYGMEGESVLPVLHTPLPLFPPRPRRLVWAIRAVAADAPAPLTSLHPPSHICPFHPPQPPSPRPLITPLLPGIVALSSPLRLIQLCPLSGELYWVLLAAAQRLGIEGLGSQWLGLQLTWQATHMSSEGKTQCEMLLSVNVVFTISSFLLLCHTNTLWVETDNAMYSFEILEKIMV